MKKGIKFDIEKNDWSLLPFKQVEKAVKILTEGKETYGKNNWQQLENGWERCFSAMMRHIADRKNGQKYDNSGHEHLSLALCELLFCMWFDEVKK